MNKAVFLDRDGVLNKMIKNVITREFEPPHKVEDLELFPWTLESLNDLQENKYNLFLISNQPDYAKGKCTLEDLYFVHEKFNEILKRNNIFFREYFYCYHHPEGINKDYSFSCECRKPKPFFVQKAIQDYKIDSNVSWMIGDRDTDIYCGQSSGLKTILINGDFSKDYRGKSNPDFNCDNLKNAVEIILSYNGNNK